MGLSQHPWFSNWMGVEIVMSENNIFHHFFPLKMKWQTSSYFFPIQITTGVSGTTNCRATRRWEGERSPCWTTHGVPIPLFFSHRKRWKATWSAQEILRNLGNERGWQVGDFLIFLESDETVDIYYIYIIGTWQKIEPAKLVYHQIASLFRCWRGAACDMNGSQQQWGRFWVYHLDVSPPQMWEQRQDLRYNHQQE